MKRRDDLIGLIPAAGYGKRISPLPCSKEVYPIIGSNGERSVVASYLLRSFKKAGIKRTYMVLRKGKWDIPEYFRNGTSVDMNIAFIVTDPTEGVPQTIKKAYPFIKQSKVIFGFPDILFKPLNAFQNLLVKQEETGADLVLGLFKTENPHKADMISFDRESNLKNIIIKPETTDLKYTWIIAVWTSVFTRFLQESLEKEEYDINKVEKNDELYIGDIVRKAIHSGLKTSYIKFESGAYLDIGTPAQLAKANNINWLKNFYRK